MSPVTVTQTAFTQPCLPLGAMTWYQALSAVRPMTCSRSSADSESRTAPAVPGDWRSRKPPPVAITWAVTVLLTAVAAVGDTAAVTLTAGVGDAPVLLGAGVAMPAAPVVALAAAGGWLAAEVAGGCVPAAGAVRLGPGLGVMTAVKRPGMGDGARSNTPTRKATRASTATTSTATTTSSLRRGDMPLF